MEEPTPQASRRALAGGLVAFLVVGGGAFLLGQKSAERPSAVVPLAPVAAAAPTPAATPTETQPETLGRAKLIGLAAAAADAAASGADTPADSRDIVGRRFDLRLPFGCDGPTPAGGGAATGWRYDEDANALRLQVAPIAWSAADWWPDAAPAGIEAIEGFWITRPWTSSETCPPVAGRAVVTGTEPVTLPGQTLAIAQFLGKDSARHGRRDGKPYTAVVRMDRDALSAGQGFQVRLTGQIAAAPGDGPALCRQPNGAEQRPVCVIAVTLDEVSIENPATDETLATWSVGPARGAE